MSNLPFFISLVFGLTTLLTILLFINAGKLTINVAAVLFAWWLFQAILGYTDFYFDTSSVPPRFIFLFAPPLVLILILLLTRKGKIYIEQLNTGKLTLLHSVRIPIELVLYWLYQYQAVPQLMTFEGRNFDILAGLSAPVIYYLGYHKKMLNRKVLLAWNFICTGLLLNIVVHALLSAKTGFQQLAFDQPNIAIQYFPFVWLPSVVVPLVLFSHLVCIRRLIINKE